MKIFVLGDSFAQPILLVIALTNDEFEHLFKMDLRLNPKFEKVPLE